MNRSGFVFAVSRFRDNPFFIYICSNTS